MNAPATVACAEPGLAAGIAFLRRPGRGVPVVLLHGIGSNAQNYVSLIEALPEDADIIAWNAPGYATSTMLAAGKPAPRDYAAALTALLDALAIPRVILVGHSLGCLFAGSFAAQHPDRVAALVLLSPALGYRVAPGGVLPAGVQARIDEIESLGPQAFADKRAARLVNGPERKPQIYAAVRDAMAAVNVAGYAQAVHALGAGDLIADCARIEAPTLVAVGAEDVITPPANARAAFEALPNSIGYHEIADAGHALPLENPAAVAHLINQLIELAHD
eukprot:gene5927-8030_t